jgi:hypothetical protein
MHVAVTVGSAALGAGVGALLPLATFRLRQAGVARGSDRI